MHIPEKLHQTPRHYALGKYMIHPDYKNNKGLEDWINNLAFEQAETDYNRMQLHSRKRNNLYSFTLPEIDKEVILKVSRISDDYKWYRRLNLWLVGLFKDYSLNAYYGGIALEKIGIKSPKVIAHWDCKRQTEASKSYLMYEKADATMTALTLCRELPKVNSDATNIIAGIAKKLAAIVRHIHQHNIRHGDPHSGNFLVTSNLHDLKELTIQDCRNLEFHLIDLDKTSFSDQEKPWKKKLLDIRCMRRFRVPGVDSITCLKLYLDRSPTLTEKLILKFWMRGGFNIYKWFKRTNKRI
jgi:serine/threonine protein kinase